MLSIGTSLHHIRHSSLMTMEKQRRVRTLKDCVLLCSPGDQCVEHARSLSEHLNHWRWRWDHDYDERSRWSVDVEINLLRSRLWTIPSLTFKVLPRHWRKCIANPLRWAAQTIFKHQRMAKSTQLLRSSGSYIPNWTVDWCMLWGMGVSSVDTIVEVHIRLWSSALQTRTASSSPSATDCCKSFFTKGISFFTLCWPKYIAAETHQTQGLRFHGEAERALKILYVFISSFANKHVCFKEKHFSQ